MCIRQSARFALPNLRRFGFAILDAINEALRPKEVEAPEILVEQNRPFQLGEDEESQEVTREDEDVPVQPSSTVNKIAWRHEEQKELKVTPEKTSKDTGVSNHGSSIEALRLTGRRRGASLT